jgi:membrane fusion protein, multidrug efflux system
MKNILNFILVFSIFLSCKKEDKGLAPISTKPIIDEEITIVKTTKANSGSIVNDVNATGIIMSDKEAKPAFKTGGVIAKMYLKEGDYVKQGQLLAKLMMNEIDAQVLQAQEQLAKAERDYTRVRNLYSDSVATLEQLQNVTTGLELSKRTVDIAKFNRNYSEVRSPISGRIVKQIMHEGEITGPGTPLYAIMGTGNADWKIMAGVIDRDWANIKVGDNAKYILDAYPDKEYNVKVSDKSAIGGNASSTIDIELRFSQQPPNLAAGLTGKVYLNNMNKGGNITSLPIESLTKVNGSIAKIFINENGIAKERVIKIGKILGEKVEVLSGITTSEEVITIGSMFLEDGDKIKINN